MFELFVVKTQFIYFWLQGYSEYFFITRLSNFVAVFVVFEHQWHKTLDENFIKEYKHLVDVMDKKTFETFKFAFAFIPLVNFYFFGRVIYQRFDTAKFIQDYGIKREL